MTLESQIADLGWSPQDCVALVGAVNDTPETLKSIHELKQALRSEGDTLERIFLRHAVSQSIDRIDKLPVPTSVQELLRQQFQVFGQPRKADGISLAVDAEENDPFIAACKICTLRRFPAGPIDWVVSGLPRRWFLQMPRRDLPKVMRYIFGQLGGIQPAFYVHIAHPPRNRSLIIAKEVRRAYYRMAEALKLQPEVKGIMCATWLHDPVAMELYPYISALSEPYLKFGGCLLTNLGPAPVSSGFLKFNSERREQYERGALKLKSVLAIWPRNAAVAWAERNRELGS